MWFLFHCQGTGPILYGSSSLFLNTVHFGICRQTHSVLAHQEQQWPPCAASSNTALIPPIANLLARRKYGQIISSNSTKYWEQVPLSVILAKSGCLHVSDPQLWSQSYTFPSDSCCFLFWTGIIFSFYITQFPACSYFDKMLEFYHFMETLSSLSARTASGWCWRK